MKLQNIVILLILMSAFAIGVGISDTDKLSVNSALNNASIQLSNITLDSTNNSTNPDISSFFLIVEKYIQFVGTLLFEVMRIGIGFGQDNPQYFEADFILYTMKLIVWLVIISLLIKPIGWLIVFMIVGAIALKDKLNKRKCRQAHESVPKGEKHDN